MNKTMLTILCLSAAVGLLVLVGGCLYDNLNSHVVVTEKVVVQFDEYRETGTIGSSVVADKFKERLLDALERNNATLDDVETISMIGGLYKVAKPSKAGHDWEIKGDVTIARQDDPQGPVTDGPEEFIPNFDEKLTGAKGKPILADLNKYGVALVDRALADLLKGQNPRLIITMNSSDITPVPSASDPLSFSWLAEVTFQAVVKVHLH
jgi:hypothetical protein